MKVIIIGAGVSGLSTGCYLQMKGFDTTIFEMHNISGGVCTSWKRGNYLFDHCLHWVMGINKNHAMQPYYEELEITKNLKFHQSERLRKLIYDNKIFTVYADLNKFKNELIGFFPGDKKVINRFFSLIKFFTKFHPPMNTDFAKIKITDILKMIPFIPSLMKLMKISIEDYLNKTFKNPELRNIFYRLLPIDKMPALMTILPLAYYHNKEGGYPIGGSLNFARTIEKKYKSLNGKIEFNKKIKKIIIHNNIAIGIETINGEKYYSDIVISACDGNDVLFNMLEGRYLSKLHKKMYDSPSLWPPIVAVSLGVNIDLKEEAEIVDFKLDAPVKIGGQYIDWLGYFQFCKDPNFAPSGKSVIEIQIDTDYLYWKKIHDTDKALYNKEKEKVLEFCIEQLNKFYPGIKNKIEISDVATPVTWENTTGNWRGSFEGWLPNVDIFGKYLPSTLPGLSNFYMTGQWTTPGGGIPLCIIQGKKIAAMLYKKFKNNL